MEFTKIISSPVFAASAPDIGLEAQSASPVKIVVTTPSASWDITLSPVTDASGKNLLNIRLRDILSAVASAPDPSETEPNSAISLLTVNLSASNAEGEQATMDIPVAFGTLNGKDPKDFTGQWLTSREQICLTYSWARERLSLIFGPQLLRWSGSVSLTVNCRAYYASGKARNFQLVSAGSSDTVYYSVDCSYSAISALDDSGEQLVAWDLSYTLSGINADGESDSVDSFPQRFILANQDGRIREYIFANCFGMEDRVFGEGVARREVNGSSSTFVNGGKTLEVSNDAEIVYEAFSGQLADRRAVFHWYDFLSSSSRLIFSAADGSMSHIVVEGHDSETDDFSVGGVSFSYRLSEKNGVYPDGLCGTIGDYDPNQQCGALWVGDDPQAVTPAEEDLFFLKHRLSEFQTLTASDALLLLAQSPATDAWGSISLGSIKSWIKKFLDGESREIRLNSLADYETADGKVIDPSKLQNGSIPVWDAAAGAYHPVPASELGDYGINPKLYPLVFQKGKDVVLTYAPNVGKAVLDISDFASAETLSTHISDKDIHVTAEQKSAWDLVASLFGVDADGNIYVKDNRGFYGNSFISARGSDPEAGSGGGGGGLDEQAMWYALGQPTTEKINASHIPAIGMDKVSGLADALADKLSGITGEMVTEALGYTPYDASQIGSASVKYAASAGKVAHALSIVAGDVTTVYDGSAAKSVTVPTAEQIALWDKVGGLFDLDADGNVYVKGNRGFYGNSFVSARGSDPGAGSGGGSGVDMDSVWYALAQPTTEKINVSHIPALQQLSGTLTNAQLANSSLSVAGVSVPLGGSVSAEQIASALGLGSNAYTSTAYLPLAGGTMSGTLTFPTATEAYNSLGVRFSGVSSRIGVDAAGGLGLYAQDAIYLRPSWTSGGTLYGLIIKASDLTYNGNPLLHSGNYTNYTVTKTGGGASGMWGISISGTATYATVLSSNSSTAVSNYLKYCMISGQTSLVGSNAANGAWCLPTTGGDAKYGNGQILRFGWAQNYYTDLHTGPNEIGANSGLQFRQVVAGTVSSLGWRTLLDTANYSATLDTRYLLKSSYTASDILAKLKTVDGSGSGLDADLLDGYQATSFQFALSNNYELSLSGGSRGKYVILLHPDTLSTAGNALPAGYSVQGTFHLFRPLGNGTASIIVKSGAGYSFTWANGSIIVMPDYNCFTSAKLVTCNYGGKLYRALFVDAVQDINNLYFRGVVMNRDANFGLAVKYYDYGTGAVTNSEVNGSIADFQRYRAILFPQLIEGTITSAQKLATARLLWGRSFDGSGDISGNIIVGDAIIHGAVTSNNTRFISSDSASNIYFSVGGLVDLVAEPSCLRRGASNTSETLGTSTYRWANVYAVSGNYSGDLAVLGRINNALMLSQFGVSADNSDTTRFLINGHRLEFGGPGYAHQNYYFRPQYSANGVTYADVYIQNASAAASPVFTNTHYFDHNGNAYHAAHVGIGMAPTGNGLDVNGLIYSTTGIYSDGYVSAKGQDTTSDARYKRDVAALPAQAALAVLMRLRPATWSWRDDGRRGAGFVAQEVLGVLPEAVREAGGGKDRHLALNYQMLHAYEVCMLQTHETELERLRSRVNQLENEIKRIRHGA